jgi:hypothetical protein
MDWKGPVQCKVVCFTVDIRIINIQQQQKPTRVPLTHARRKFKVILQ